MPRCLPEKSHHVTDLAGIREVYCGAREGRQKGGDRDREAGREHVGTENDGMAGSPFISNPHLVHQAAIAGDGSR